MSGARSSSASAIVPAEYRNAETAIGLDRARYLAIRSTAKYLALAEPPLIADSARKHRVGSDDILHAF